ncbi:MAG: hypothetical protein E7575_01920 [Ruminococcaceae bacterium]|nr:hypothetical protein [Oscillospiraceae bacterium]
MSKFSIEKKGYSVAEVDAYVEDMEAKYQRALSQTAELEQKLATAKRLIRRFSDTENALKQNIADSKRAAAYMISDAKERSFALLDETRESCGEIISDLDMKISERMNTVDLIKATVGAFRDELFNLYSAHIELIDTLAQTAEDFEYDPDYSPIADAVDRFEENGEPDCELVDFVEYPDESIFAALEDDEDQLPGEFNLAEMVDESPESTDEDISFESSLESDADADISQINMADDEDFFEKSIDEAESEEDEPKAEKTEDAYFKFLSDFANSEETENE